MTNIKEIEELKEAVIKKHFAHYYDLEGFVRSGASEYTENLLRNMEHDIDKKILFYVQLGISAKDLMSN